MRQVRWGLLLAFLAVSVTAQVAEKPQSAKAPAEVTFAAAEAYAIVPQVGEPVQGFPSWAERVIHQWINRARSDPQAELRNCQGCLDAACYAPVPPLGWNAELNRAARFHSDEMRAQRFFAHDSRCVLKPDIATLYPGSCDGAAECACKQAGATSWTMRVALFGTPSSGEIIAGGSDPNAVFYLWLHEWAQSNTCDFTIANGHRWLILKSTGAVGVGVSSNYSVGDFGVGTTPLKIVSGAHYPRQAATVELWANWYDFAAPRSASVVIDGQCVPMTLRRGSPQNGAYLATASGMDSGCHRYYFVFTDAAGNAFTYPSSGSYGIGPCADWDSSRALASCSSAPSRRRLTRR